MHATVRATSVQLVFGRDSILNVKHVADWKYMQSQKQDMIVKNNIKENRKQKECAHELNKLVLIEQDWSSEHGTASHGGPHPITKINNNGAVQVQMDKIVDTINIHQLKPYNAWVKPFSISLKPTFIMGGSAIGLEACSGRHPCTECTSD